MRFPNQVGIVGLTLGVLTWPFLGQVFSQPINLSQNTGTSDFPAVAFDGSNNVHVVWADDTSGNKEILAKRSTDGGLTFSSAINISSNTGTSESPAISFDGSNKVRVVWADDTSGNKEILARHSTDGGLTFSSTINISSNTGTSESPAVAFDGGNNVHVVWADDTSGNKEILAKRSTDGGLTFSSTINISSTTGTSESPAVAFAGSNNVLVGWADDTSGNKEILAKRSTDGGITFSSASNISSDTGKSLRPRLVLASSGGGGFVWQDDTPGNFDIFSRGVNLANLPPVANAGPDQTIECSSQTGTAVQLDASGSSDPDGDPLSFEWKDGTGTVVGTTATVNVTLQPGIHIFTLTVSDGTGGAASDSVVVRVQDTTPPTLSFTLSPNVLWPPDHRLVRVTATIEASDICTAAPTVVLVSITSTEPDNGLGDGDTANDIQGAGFGIDDRSFLLRAERAGAGSGRVYTVRYRTGDASGNTTFATGQVIVPQGKAALGNKSPRGGTAGHFSRDDGCDSGRVALWRAG